MRERRGVLGWTVSIIVAMFGCMFVASAGAFGLELVMWLVASTGAFDRSFMQTGGQLLYLSINAQMLFTLFGAGCG